MTITDIVNLFVNNGVAIAVIIYFMFRDYKFNQQIVELMTAIKSLLEIPQVVNGGEEDD